MPTTPTITCAALLLLASGGPGLAQPMAPAGAELLPVRDIILYRSGVGYFERRGAVQGEARVGLRFDAEQINDILKSLVLLDLDGGRIEAVSYASKEPLVRRLAGFGVDVSEVESVVDLLEQLRGAAVRLDVPGTTIEGTVLAVEDRMSVFRGDGIAHFNEPYVSIITKRGIRSIAISTVTSLTLADEQLAAELDRALAALAEARTERVKTVDLAFTGAPDQRRRVVAAYIHEMPVWKTSYRLVLAESGEPNLRGWAIVENTTDSDWNGVQLSLASGRPVSFTMELDEPLFMPRPDVPVPLDAGVRPKLYEVGRGASFDGGAEELGRQQGVGGGGSSRSRGFRGGTASTPPPAPDAQEGGFGEFYSLAPGDMVDYAAGVQASGQEAGEQFLFTVDAPVTLERQRSAMLPILSTPVEGRRVSIYSRSDGRKHPMRGIEFTNTSNVPLLPGPVAVYDEATYAGDAQIGHTARGQERLLAYAVDLDVEITIDADSTTDIRSFRIVDGVLIRTSRQRTSIAYRYENADAKRGRTVILEEPRQKDWDLVEPSEPTERTDNLDRFEIEIEPGAAGTFEVVRERTLGTSIALVGADLDDLIAEQRNGKVSEAVLDAIRKAQEIQARKRDLETTAERLRAERSEISSDQSRIRSNMSSVDRNSDLYARYIRKLDEQESRLEDIESRLEDLSRRIQVAEFELREFLRDLDVR